MAGPFEQSLEEVHILFDALSFPSENIVSNSNHHVQSSSASQSPISKTTIAKHPLITKPPSQLELRQNNPQDCQNLIIASVDRATVEISRTIIALNATFSQQLQQVSISASNGIKAAQDSASSSIGVVVQSADIATSSASFMVTVANRAVVSATSALADISLSSSNDVASLSSSLGLLQASLTSLEASGSAAVSAAQASVLSLQASASAAIAAAQAALASVTGSAAAQASSLLASANANLPPTATQTVVGAGQTIPGQPLFQVPSNVSLTPAQIAGITVGAVAASVLLSLAVYFATVRLRRRRHDSYKDEKYNPRSPKEVQSRWSSAPRTGNTMTVKFNPPKSSNVPLPTRSALRSKGRTSMERPIVPQISPLDFQDPASRNSAASTRVSNPAVWPLDSTVVDSGLQPPPVAATEWPLPSSSLNQEVPFSFDLPVPEVSGALTEPGRLLEVDDRPWDEIEEERNSRGPFSDHHGNAREEFVDPFEDTLSVYSVPDAQAFDFGIVANSASGSMLKPEEAANPFDDPATTSTDEPLESYEYSHGQKFVDIEPILVPKSGTTFTESAQHQLTEQPFKPSVPDPESSQIPSLLQLQTAFMEKSSKRIEQPKDEVLEAQSAKVATESRKDVTTNPPSFLKSYNPPMPKVEKILSPPPRRRPSLGSVRPLRKMLPPRQKTVSPPRRVKTSEVEKNNTVQVTTSPGALLREPLPTIPSTVTTEETGPQPLRQPSTQDLREKTLSPLRRNPVVVESLAEAEVVPVGIATKDVEPVIPVMMEEAKRSTYQQNTPHHSLVLGEKDLFFAAGGGEGVEETESDDRQYRGRSMIRTSDIIEARLSMNSQIQEDWKSLQALEARLSSVVQKSQPIISSSAPNNENNKMDIDIGKSPLRRNPVDISSIPRISMHRRTKTLPAPRQHIHRANVTKRRSRSLSPIRLVNKFLQLDRSPILPLKSPLRLNPLDTITTKRRSRSLSPPRPPILSLQPIPRSISRDDSPLRRNPTRGHSPMVSFGVDSKPSNPSTRVPKVASNGLFAQSLSKFQNLASQNPQDAMMASTEVTQRAIAGIFIPGSLREEAVRTVSKSRERRGD